MVRDCTGCKVKDDNNNIFSSRLSVCKYISMYS